MLRPSTNVIIPRRQQQTQLSRTTRGFAVCEQRANILNEVTNNTYNNKRSSRGPPAVSLADHPRSQDITAAQGAPSKRTMEYPCSPQRRRSTRLCHKPAGTCTLTTMVWQVHTVHASRTDAPNTRPRSNSDSDGSDRSDRSYHSDSDGSDRSDRSYHSDSNDSDHSD
jgi:hypothetical protein